MKCGKNDIFADDAISRLEMCIKDSKWMTQNALKLEDKIR